MKVINKKVNWLLEEKGKWVYKIYLNGFFEMTMKVQKKKDYEEDDVANYAMATCSMEDYKMLSIVDINNIFTWLKTKVDKYGFEYVIDLNHFYSSKLHTMGK